MSSIYRTPTPLDTGGRLLRRWKPACIAFSVMFALIGVGTRLLPNKYESRAKILVKNSRVNPLVSLDQQTQGVLYVDEVSEERINTEIELLTSTDVLRQVVSRCHLSDLVKGSVANPDVRNNIALRQLEKDLRVSAVRKSDIIEVSYDSTDPRRSAQVVRTLADVYMATHLRLHGSPGSSSFFKAIAAKYLNELKTTEAELADFRQAHHIVELPEEKSLALQQTADLEKSLTASSAATRHAREETNQLNVAMSKLPGVIEQQSRSIPNQSSEEQLALLLVSLKNKRAEAVERYVPSDRIVTELDTEIRDTQDALDAARQGRATEVTSAANPIRLSAEDLYLRSSADYRANLAQTDELSQELRANRSRLADLDVATIPYDDLQRSTKQLQELADFYTKKSDEARVNDLLDMQRISNVTIAEQPFQAEVPSSPKRGLILSLGFLWSLLVAGATALLFEMLNERITSPYQLDQIPDLPLLAALPSLAIAPSFGGAFPAVYASMQRTNNSLRG